MCDIELELIEFVMKFPKPIRPTYLFGCAEGDDRFGGKVPMSFN